jgi:hypothetical protein
MRIKDRFSKTVDGGEESVFGSETQFAKLDHDYDFELLGQEEQAPLNDSGTTAHRLLSRQTDSPGALVACAARIQVVLFAPALLHVFSGGGEELYE